MDSVVKKAVKRSSIKEIQGQKRDGGFFAAHCNQECQDAALKGDVTEAEHWVAKLAASGKELHIDSLNELIQALCRAGDLEGAERWFQRVVSPLLHPELQGLQPDATTFNTMIQAFAEHHNVPRSEKYAQDAMDLGMTLGRKSYAALVDACLLRGDVRRAHHWSEAMIHSGFSKPNKDVMRKLIRGLTDSGNVQSASKWIAFMAEMGTPLDSNVYAYVRDAHPMEIMPCKLSGEAKVLAPPGVRPVKLSGEDELTPVYEARPVRPASVVLPPRSPRPRAAAAHWPARLVTEVRLAASEKMSPPVKAEFFKACSHDVAGKDAGPSSARRAPRFRYMKGEGRFVLQSRSARESSRVHTGDAAWNPPWLDDGPPPVRFERLQYGGPDGGLALPRTPIYSAEPAEQHRIRAITSS